jgi:hypothetical protein
MPAWIKSIDFMLWTYKQKIYLVRLALYRERRKLSRAGLKKRVI